MDNYITNNKLKNIGMLSLVVILSGCFDSDIKQTRESSTPQPEAVKTLDSADHTLANYIPATVVPTTNGERKALLAALNINADSPLDKRRLALFVRYTYFADNPDRQLQTLEQLIAEIAEMRQTRLDDHELTALYGSATSLQTVFFLDNLGKTNLLSKKGSRYLDRAVKSAPNHLGVRLYRGITYAEMPAFLGKARQAVTDFALLKSASRFSEPKTTHPANDKFAAMIDYYHAMALIKDQQQSSGMEQLAVLAHKNITPWSQRAAVLKKEKG